MAVITLFNPRVSEALRVQRRVIGALILRDMKTRFGRSHLSYLVAIAWPLGHMLGIMGVQFITGRVVPIGTDLAIFAATGVLPYILCIYPARMTMMAIKANRPLLLFSIVKTTDMIIARIILEILTACVVGFIFLMILYTANVNLQPIDISEAVIAVIVSIYLGVSIGVLNAILFVLFDMVWLVTFILLSILMYTTSGAFILSSTLSSQTRDILWYNPLFQCVEWLRSAYYDGYASSSLSRLYIIGFATVFLFLGLASERLFRGRFYQS